MDRRKKQRIQMDGEEKGSPKRGRRKAAAVSAVILAAALIFGNLPVDLIGSVRAEEESAEEAEAEDDGEEAAALEETADDELTPEEDPEAEEDSEEVDESSDAYEELSIADGTENSDLYADDEIIIVYEDDSLGLDDSVEVDDEFAEEITGNDSADVTLEDTGVVEQEEIISSDGDQGAVVVAQIDEDSSVEELVEELSEDPDIAWVQPNYSYELFDTDADDPYLTDDADAEENQYYLFESGFTEAWEAVKAEGTVTVAVIDTGCNLSHEDLQGTLLEEYAYDVKSGSLLSESGVANSGDSSGHGTMVCGIIAAEADNGTGIAGASWNADILPVRVYDDEEGCSTSDIISAYEYLDSLIDAGSLTDLRVINMSLGYYADSLSEADLAVEDAIEEMLEENGVLTVCAGGNGDNSGSAQTANCYPADFDACVSVTAVDADGSNSAYSDYNAAKDISAYGEDILSTDNSGGYSKGTGTSYASPQVAAAAALLWAADASLTPSEVVNILQETASDVTGNAHESSGSAGVLDVSAAVQTVTGVSVEAEETEAADSLAEAETAEPSVEAEAEDASEENTAAGGSENTSEETAEAEEDSTSASEAAGTGNTDADEEPAEESAGEEEESSESETEEASGGDSEISEESAEAEDEDLEIEEEANSWRYADGLVIQYPETNGDSLSIGTLSSAYSIWKSSYGTSYLGIKSGSSTTTVKVSGVERVGIDVSRWQGDIDWEEVADDGIDFVIIRCGYGSDHEDQDDCMFLENVEGALGAGLDIGVYLYSYATKTTGSDGSAESEAEHVLRLLDEAGLEPDDLAYPVFYDMEDSTQEDLSASKLGDIAETFCSALEDEGYMTGIYANKNWWETILTDSYFDSVEYRWVARYPISSSTKSSGVSDTDLWQFTSNGTVSGIDGSVDVNFDYNEADSYVATPGTPTISSATVSSSYDSVTLKWSQVSNASGYYVYRSTDGKSYSKIKTITGGSTLSYTDSTVESGKIYYYKVKAYRTSGSETLAGTASSAKSVTIKPSTVTLSSVTLSTSLTSATIKWSKVSNATGYQIYRSSDGGSTYSKVKTITSGSTTSYTNSSLSLGKTYKYKVRAYVTLDSGTLYGNFSSSKSVTTKPSKVSITSASTTTSGYVKVKWSKVSNATGYVIYRSTNGGSYSKVKTISSSSTTSWTDSSVKPGRVYRYKIRSYKKSGSTTVYSSSYSSVKKVTAKPAKVTISSVSSSSSRSATVKWKKVSNATGYQVAYRRKGSSTWHYVTVSTNYKKFTLLRKKNYYVKVRAYTKYNGTKYYGSWSSEKYMKVK